MTTTRRRYQFGCLSRGKRVRSEDVWQFRFYETTLEGRRCRRSRIIGTLVQYPTRRDALNMVERFRLRLNLGCRFGRPVSFNALADRYVEQELPKRRYGTQQAYRCMLEHWIRPRWGALRLEEIKPLAVEEWLFSLGLADNSKENLVSLLQVIYEHGRRWELIDSNPIDLVRQPGGRRSIPRVLTAQEIRRVLGQLDEPYRTMFLVAACLGLRASEIMGLQWGDFNWQELTLLVKRSVVNGHVGETKNGSLSPSAPGRLASGRHFARTTAAQPLPWTFGLGLRQPSGNATSPGAHPAAVFTARRHAARIGKIGLHTFRHSYSTMLRAAEVDLKVQQELLRHSTIQSTMNIYTQAVGERKRAANRLIADATF